MHFCKLNRNRRGGFSLVELLLTVAIIGLPAVILLPALAPPAHAAVELYSNQEVRSFTNTTAIAGSSFTNINRVLDLRSGKNHMTLFKFAMGASSTDPIQFWLYPVPDGTNRLTTSPIVLSVAANGTTAVVAGTNLLASVWDGNRKVCLWGVSNAHASAVCYLTNSYLVNIK